MLRICMRRGPHLLVENDGSNGAGRETDGSNKKQRL